MCFRLTVLINDMTVNYLDYSIKLDPSSLHAFLVAVVDVCHGGRGNGSAAHSITAGLLSWYALGVCQ